MDNQVNNTNYDKNIFKNTFLNISRNKIASEKFQSLFEKYDIDHNGTLDTINPKTGANELEELRLDYEKIIEKEIKNSEDADNLKVLFNNIINYIKNGNPNGVYYNGKEMISNGKIDEEMHQSKETGNCWFISRLNALSDTDFGTLAIKNAIDKDSDGNYTLKLKYPEEEIIIPAEELQLAVDSGKYSDGELDGIILELGIEKSVEKAIEEIDEKAQKSGKISGISIELLTYMKTHDNLPAILEGGDDNPVAIYLEDRRDIIKRLTGLEEIEIPKDMANLEGILKEKSRNPRSLTLVFDSKYNIETQEEWEDEDEHNYSIKKVTTDKSGNITGITVINPWNNKKEINISFEEFKIMCEDSLFISSADKNITKRIQTHKSDYELIKFKKVLKNPPLCNPLDTVLLPEDKKYKQRAINETGGLKAFFNKLKEINREYYETELSIYKEGGLNDLLKFNGKDPQKASKEEKTAYQDYIRSPLEERINDRYSALLFYYCDELGFTNQETEEIINNPEKAKEYCTKYNYRY